MSSLPVVNEPPRHVGSLIGHVARRLRLRSELVLTRLGLRPRPVVTLALLRDHGGCSQQALPSRLGMDATNGLGLLHEIEAENLAERRPSPPGPRRHAGEITRV